MTELICKASDLSVKRIGIDEMNLVIDLFNKYRVFYKQDSDLILAETFLKERLSNNESVIFIVLNGKTPVGFTQLYPTYSSVRAVKNWILNDLYVDESHRKQGIGKLLIDTVMEFAKTTSSKYVQLETAVNNNTAQHLYESIGFIKQVAGSDFFMYRKTVD